MAAKIEYVVVDGCIQDGTKIIRKGEVYVPPSAEIRELLVAEGRIAARGKLESSAARAPKRTNAAGSGGAPVPTSTPNPTDGGGNPDEEEEEEEEEEGDDLNLSN